MINDCSIKTAEDEVVLRQYKITELDYRTKLYKKKKTPRRKKGKYNTQGNLYVTNRRLIYNIDNRSLPYIGLKCKDLYSQQIRIEDIQGIDFMSSTMRPPVWGPIILMVLGILLFLIGIFMFIGIPLLIIGIIWLILRLRRSETSMVFGIRSPSSGYSLFVSEMSRGYGGNVQYWCAPTKEFEKMALELGAIVLDLQKYGDECISKWMSTSEQRRCITSEGRHMLGKDLSRKQDDQVQLSRPSDIGSNIKTNSSTDSKDLSVTIDGDKFNINVPSLISNPVISIPGVGINGLLTKLNFDKRMLSTHIAMVGGIGTGKSNLFNHMISQVRQRMTAEDVAIIFDTKGDFLKDFGRQDDIVISNTDQARGSSGIDYWNIFNEIDPDDPEASTREICSSLFKESMKKTSNAFFPNAASDLLYAFMMIFYRNWKIQQRKDPTNKDLVDFFKSSTPERLYNTLVAYKFTSVASHIADPKSGQAQGVIAEMNSVINRIFIGNFVKSGTISMSNLVKQRGGRTVFIEYDIQTGDTLTPIYSLLVDMALKQALSNRSEHKGSVYLFVDEFKLLPNLSHIDDAVNFGRSLGMKVFIALQSITQMYDNYGEMRAKSILSGFLNYMFFNVNNAESREFIKARFGKCLRKVNYGTGKDYVYIDDVVKDKDITRLDVGEMIVGLSNCEPFIFKSSQWKP